MMKQLQEPIRIGSLEISNRLLLAPLAGVSDIPFRRICQELGAGFTYVEMLSSRAVIVQARRTAAMAARHATEPQLGLQVTGANADEVGLAIAALDNGEFDSFDLNMGCPVRKIVGKGWGAALLKEPARVASMIRRARDETDRPVTGKIRLGWSRPTENVEETAAAIADAGALMLTIHGRTRDDNYSVKVDYAGIARGVNAARRAASGDLVVTGNGDIMNAESAERMVMETGCDALMISRGALGNPWIFREILEGGGPGPTVTEWREVLLRHMDYHEAHYVESNRAAVLFRKHLLWYLNGFPGARKMRATCSVVATMNDAREQVDAFAAGLPSDLHRYDDRYRSIEKRPEASHDPKYDMDRKEDRGVGAEV